MGLGAVLTQVQDGNHVPICYASCSFTTCEQRYSQTERKALALVRAWERFHPYIYGTKFELLTDHKPLEAISNPRSRPSARVERWTLRLQPYNFKVVYIPGKQNVTDSLSHLLPPHPKPAHHHIADEYVQFVTHAPVPNAMSLREGEEATIQDDELAEVKQAIAGSGSANHICQSLENFASVANWFFDAPELYSHPSFVRKLWPLPMKDTWASLLLNKICEAKSTGLVWTKPQSYKSCHSCQLVAQPNPPEPIRSTVRP